MVLEDGGEPRLLTEADGLPGMTIRAMAAYGDKLYLAMGGALGGKDAFAVYDPAAREHRILFSNTAVGGLRRNLMLKAMVVDEERKCLWLGSEWAGIWRFDPATDKMEKVAPVRFMLGPHGIHPMALCSVGLLYADANNVSMLDLSDYKQTFLIGNQHSGPNGYKDVPLMGSPAGMLWPACFIGDDLITGGGDLGSTVPPYAFIHRPGKEAALTRSLCAVRLFEPTPHGLLAMDCKGEGYLIRKLPEAK